jgi:very-short-patch-repair endonuclease
MDLKDRILTELQKGRPLKAKAIASALGDVTIKEVNSILYSSLRTRASQNSKYEWSLNEKPKEDRPKDVEQRQKADTPLSKLASYYLDCISKDLDSGISVWASNKYGKPDYIQLNQLLSDDPIAIDKDSNDHLHNKLYKERHALNVNIGYPIYLHRFTAKSGQSFFQVKPVLIQKLNKESFLAGQLELEYESPFVNSEVVGDQEGSSPSELLQDLIFLNQELGLDNVELPPLDEIASRLQMIRGSWQWQEDLDPDRISNLNLSTCNEPGIYNCSAVFLSEGSKYTKGLERELTDLQYVPQDAYSNSVLHKMLQGSIDKVRLEDKVLIEPLQTNEEQRDAIVRGLQSDLTVVTGPPGTGKSQVVSNLIVNAVYEGQKVLFASRNNKAVDVVLHRVNGLSNKPVMLRLGGADKQDDLSRYLTSILATNVNDEDQYNFDEAHQYHTRLLEKVDSLKARYNELIELRNKTDKLEQDLEQLRVALDHDVFENLKKLSNNDVAQLISFGNEFGAAIDRADKSKWSFLKKVFSFLFIEERTKEFRQFISGCSNTLQKLHIDMPAFSADKLIEQARNLFNDVKVRIAEVTQISHYTVSLKELSESESLYDLTNKEKEIVDEISHNSSRLWQLWLHLLSSRLSQQERQLIGDYLAVLDLIVKSNNENTQVAKGVWAKYYSLLPKITNILSCWAVTSLSVRSKVPFTSGFFDLLIIDEASQCDIASAIPLFYRAKRAVIIGDDKQLTFITKISTKEDHQLIEKHELTEDYLTWSYSTTSVFRLSAALCHGENIIELKDHHRSHADIISYSNKYFYNGNLRIATNYSNLNGVPNEPALRWIDVKGKVVRPTNGGSLNEAEARKVVEELRRLLHTGYQGTIGVVSPFRAQATRIRDIVFSDPDLSDRLLNKEFLADTVHKFQGDERDLMLFSPVVSAGIGKGSELFLSRTGNLFNVAITRAKAGLIVIGDRTACINSSVDHFSKFADHVNSVQEQTLQSTESEKIDFGFRYPQVASTDIVSDWEKLLYTTLYKHGIRTQPQYKIDKYSLDLALIIGERKLDIEVDGEAYHRSWNGELLRRDKIRNKRLIELGWDVQRFWVYEIRDNINNCIVRIEKWIEKVNQEIEN